MEELLFAYLVPDQGARSHERVFLSPEHYVVNLMNDIRLVHPRIYLHRKSVCHACELRGCNLLHNEQVFFSFSTTRLPPEFPFQLRSGRCGAPIFTQ
jgi:hypothetical protein